MRAAKPPSVAIQPPSSPGIGHNQPPPDVFEGRLTMSIEETGTALGIKRDSVYALIQTGRLIASKFGARTVVHTSSIRQLLGRDAAGPAAARSRQGAGQGSRAAIRQPMKKVADVASTSATGSGQRMDNP